MALDDVDQRRSTSPPVSSIFTLDPADKFLKPEPRESIKIIEPTGSTSSTESFYRNTRIRCGDLKKVGHAKNYYRKPHLSTDFGFSSSLTAVDPERRPHTLGCYSLPTSRQQSDWQDFGRHRTVRSAGVGPRIDQSNQYVERNTRTTMQHDEWVALSQLVKGSSTESTIDLPLLTSNATTHSEIGSVDSRFLTKLKTSTHSFKMTGPLHHRAAELCKFPTSRFGFSGEKSSIVDTSLPQTRDADGPCTQLNQLQLGSTKSGTLGSERLYTSILSNGHGHSHTKISPTDAVCCEPCKETLAQASIEPDPLQGHVYSVATSELDERPNQNASDVSSHTSILSPSWSSTSFTGNTSPYHISQPETPSISEFGDHHFGHGYDMSPILTANEDISFDGSKSRSESSGFRGYNLSEAEYASALTLRNLPETVRTSSKKGAPFEQKSGHELMEWWNDRANNCKTTMEDLHDDLSYLAGVIV